MKKKISYTSLSSLYVEPSRRKDITFAYKGACTGCALILCSKDMTTKLKATCPRCGLKAKPSELELWKKEFAL